MKGRQSTEGRETTVPPAIFNGEADWDEGREEIATCLDGKAGISIQHCKIEIDLGFRHAPEATSGTS